MTYYVQKASFLEYNKANGRIVKLRIQEDSRRYNATTNKCRCDKAFVVEIQDINGDVLDIDSIAANHYSDFIYKVGEMVFHVSSDGRQFTGGVYVSVKQRNQWKD